MSPLLHMNPSLDEAEPEIILAELVDAPQPSVPSPLPVNGPMIAWWGVLPAIAFVALQATLRWPVELSKAASKSTELATQLGVTGLILLIVVGIACVVYRVTQRSQTLATITFFSLMSFLSLGTVGAWALDHFGLNRPSQMLVHKSPKVGKASIESKTLQGQITSFGDFKFEVPDGWTSTRPDRAKTLAMIQPKKPATGKVDALVKVDVGKPTQPTARLMAQTFAGRDGRVLREPVMLDGVEAVRVQNGGRDLSRPRHVVVAYRGQKAYLIMAGAKGSSIAEPFEHVLKTWRWNDQEKATER